MSASKQQFYKRCIVPKCPSTTTSTPEKIFVILPEDVNVRKQWFKAMKRRVELSPKTRAYCCEDHFDLKMDLENYVRHRLIGGRVRLKKSVLPHIFNCQDRDKKPQKRLGALKRNRVKTFDSTIQSTVSQLTVIQNPNKDKPSTSKARMFKKAAVYYEDSTAPLLVSDHDGNAESEQVTTEEPMDVHYINSQEPQKGTMRLSLARLPRYTLTFTMHLSGGSLFPETPVSVTQELMMDLHKLSDKIQNFYPAALGKQFTLAFQGEDGDKSEYIFTSSSKTRRSGERHSSIRCNECGSDIVGFRYKCTSCADYDLCSACENLGLHTEHIMMRIAKPIKLTRSRKLLQKWCEAAASINNAEDITRSQNNQPDSEPDPQQPAPSSSKSLLLEPPPLAPLSSSTKIATGKALTKAKAKATKKSTSEEQPKKSDAKKRKIETSKGEVTFEI